MNIVAFFNNKGRVGKTTLLYHVAYMLADQGERVLVVDLDPQANASSMLLDERRMEELWPEGEHPDTIYGAVRPIVRGIGDVTRVHVEVIQENLGLVVGDLTLSTFEDRLSETWPKCLLRDEAAFRSTTAFFNVITLGAESFGATWVLLDVGPNLGAINRASLIASEYVVVPLGPDLFSLQGLRNLGPAIRGWREAWSEMRVKSPSPDIRLPSGSIEPIGYVVLQHGVQDNRPPKAYQKWIDKFPTAFRAAVVDTGNPLWAPDADADEYRLASIKHYRSLMPMDMESRKPVFRLKPADGAIGAHGEAVRNAYTDFERLVKRIRKRVAETQGI